MTRIRSRAFTLIELIIVVGIIAVLAAIAIPNFLSAQTRSKVARVKSDLRTLAGALQAYAVDYNSPPLDWNVSRGDPQLAGMAPGTSGILHPGRNDAAATGSVHAGLTTPVAYVADCWKSDPFVAGADLAQVPFDQQKYTYNWFAPNPLRGVPVRPEYIFQEYQRHYGYWRLGSVGPDRDFYNGSASLYAASQIYEPTNGTVSLGNIWRSEREPDVRTRPPFDQLLIP